MNIDLILIQEAHKDNIELDGFHKYCSNGRNKDFLLLYAKADIDVSEINTYDNSIYFHCWKIRDEILLINVHLPSKQDKKKKDQIEMIKNIVKKEKKVIIMGDFNLSPYKTDIYFNGEWGNEERKYHVMSIDRPTCYGHKNWGSIIDIIVCYGDIIPANVNTFNCTEKISDRHCLILADVCEISNENSSGEVCNEPAF